MKQARGFTLIEIAVVLFIVSLLIGAITSYVTAQVTAAKLALTQTRQAAIKTALTNFIARNNRLPCPAIPTLASGAAGNGVETPQTPVLCFGSTLDPPRTVATGAVPWASLGLPSDAAFDGYNNRFTYQVTMSATATTLTAQTVAGIRGQISIHDAGPGAVGSPAATPPGNQSNDCRADKSVAYVAIANPCSAVVIIVSHGPNGFGAYTDAGIQMPVATADEQENANADSKFVMKQYSDIAANPFDDIVLSLTPVDLISGLTSAGSMQSALATVNANFNLIKSAVIAYAVQNRTGSFVCVTGTCTATTNCPTAGLTCETTTFTYTILPPDVLPDVADPTGNPIPSVLSLPSSVTNDPWGNAIRYARTTANATITSAAPAASAVAFILRSAGPDGTLGNGDDVFTTVTVGELKSQFSKF
jgi:prepilin-type N-terminal cleavage/methylation domain-containing protein